MRPLGLFIDKIVFLSDGYHVDDRLFDRIAFLHAKFVPGLTEIGGVRSVSQSDSLCFILRERETEIERARERDGGREGPGTEVGASE
jgi:hypothetical protein